MRTRNDRKGQTSHRPGSQEVREQPLQAFLQLEAVFTVSLGNRGQPEGFPIPEEVLRRNNISVFRVRGDCMRETMC